MSALQKEQIYVELRKYHLDELPESFVNSSMNDLLSDYRKMEDETISMLLGLVNGKSEYIDFTETFDSFSKRISLEEYTSADLLSDTKHFNSKLLQLIDMVNMAKDKSFPLNKARQARQSTRSVITKTNKL